jgi:LPXTG-motif cell wall-anchored protein
MRHLAPLVAVYAVIVGLVLPSSILAQEESAPAPVEETTTTVTETTPAEPPPTEAPPPAPPEPAPVPTAPEPQFLADERDEKPAPKPPKARAAASGGVTIVDFSFSPATITIDVGDSVTWTNNGPTAHSATADNGSFDTGIFPAGQSRSHTFNDAGSFSYFCQPHPNMRGTIVVQAAQVAEDTTDSAAPAQTTETDTGGPALPNTGTDAGALLLLGLPMLLLGVAVHRRSRPREPQPVGRIGW